MYKKALDRISTSCGLVLLTDMLVSMKILNLLRKSTHKNALIIAPVITIIIAIGVITYTRVQVQPATQFFTQTSASSTSKFRKVTPNSILLFDGLDALDEASLKANLLIPENLEGELRMQVNNVQFKPSAPLPLGTTLDFVVQKGAMQASGIPIAKDITYTFSVEGAPTVVSRLPAPESVAIPTDAVVSIVFDRPMVPLTTVYTKQSIQFNNWPITISPAIEGNWNWLGTSTVEFRPANNFMTATEYTVTVPNTFTDLNGDAIADSYAWSFSTKRPKVVDAEPFNGYSLAAKDTEVVLEFSNEVDLETLQKAITFSVDAADAVPLNFTLVHAKKMIEKQEVVHKKSVVLIPAEPLSLNTSYTVQIPTGTLGMVGNLGFENDYTLRFKTAGPFKVLESEVYDYGIRLQFTNPYKQEGIKQYITITPEPLNWQEYEISIDTWDESHYLTLAPELEPSTKYTLSIAKEFGDKFGQNLLSDYVLDFTTKPIDPKVFIHSNGEFGIFERSRQPVYYLNAVNVSHLNVAVAPLTLQEFIAIQREKQNNYSYTPTIAALPSAKTFTVPYPRDAKDRWQSITFNAEEKMGGPLQSGIYALTLKAPEYKNYLGQQIVEQQYFAMTNMAITVKYTANAVLVWVVDITTGNPVQAAAIEIYTEAGKQALTGTTDAQGFFESVLYTEDLAEGDSYDPTFWVTAQKADDFAFVGSKWGQGIEAYNFGVQDAIDYNNTPEYQVQVYMYTDRPLYRAGDEVHFKGIARLRDQSGVMYPANTKRTALVKVTDAQDKVIYDETLPITEYGTFAATLPIANYVSLGVYTIASTILPEADIGGQYNTQTFQVLAYRKPEYKASIAFENEEYFSGDTVKATITGEYYFGSAMQNAAITWRAMSTDYFFNKYTEQWFSFSNNDDWCWYNCERNTTVLTSGKGVLNEKGQYNVSFPATIDPKDVSQIASLEATISDRNNQQVSAFESVAVHKAGTYVGIQAQNYGIEPGQSAEFSLITLQPSGAFAANIAVELELFEQQWNSIKKKDVDGKYYYENEVKNTSIKTQKVTTNTSGSAKASFVMPKGGSYKVVARATDSKGRTQEAATTVYAYSSTYFNWPRTNSDRIEVTADKPEYSVGDTAKLLVKSPYQGTGVRALVTIERETIMKKYIVDVQSNALPLEVPITEEMIPNAYVSVVIIKPRDGETFNENGLDTGLPAFKMGLQKLNVETLKKTIDVSITTDQKKYLPRQTVSVALKTVNAEGVPVSADVSLSVVDTSLLALTGYTKPNLVEYFYSLRPLKVRTAQMLLYMLERFKPGSKGGGGSDGDADGKRSNFKDTAYWNASIITNEQGEATVSFALPDNLTTWQLLAIANTKSSTFGAEDIEIIETKQVIVRPVRPRFAVQRDQIELGAIVHNFLEETQTFTVTLAGDGFEHLAKNVQTITIAPNQQKKINFPVKIIGKEIVRLQYTAETTNARDEVEETIPVFVFSAPQYVATSGVTESTAEEQLYIPNTQNVQNLAVALTLSPTVATYLPAGLEYLAEYPYGCAEQIMSTLLPNISVNALQEFAAFRYLDDGELSKKVITGVELLYPLQRSDGGFGYWAGSVTSNPTLSAYITYGLEQSKQDGFAIDQKVLDRSYTFLENTLRKKPAEFEPWEMSDALRAQILFTLAEGNRTDVQLLNNLYPNHTDLPLFAKSFYAMALQKAQTPATTEKAIAVLQEIVNTAKVHTRGVQFEEENERLYRWSMNTNTRTTALALMAMVRIDPTNVLLPKVVRHLLSVRENGHWDTTQSTSFTILALTEYLQRTKELDADFMSTVRINDTVKNTTTFDANNIFESVLVTLNAADLAKGELTAIAMHKEGPGRLYYDVTMQYDWLADELPPVAEGMSILRQTEPLDGVDTTFTAGELYKVTLTLTTPDDRHQVAVESMLPAGFEAINTQFKTESTALDEAVNQTESTSWYDWWQDELRYFNHTEFRDDRVLLFADYLPAGVYKYEYIVRASVPGIFYERPARFFEMYFPENFAQTAGGILTIEDAQ